MYCVYHISSSQWTLILCLGITLALYFPTPAAPPQSSALQELQGELPRAAAPGLALKGDYTLKIKAKKFNGAPAAGAAYSLHAFHPQQGFVPARQGTLDAKGEAQQTGLPGGEGAPMFVLEMFGDYMEQLQFDGPEKTVSLDLTLPCGPGDIAPDIVMLDADSGAPMKLSALRGQVVFLEFWATWCGPCQKPMEHNNEILSRRAADWRGKAAIVAVSIDDTRGALTKHIARNRWFAITHKWVNRGGTRFESQQAKAYGVSGVPTALLILPDGTITWRGHPASVNVEQMIDEAMKTSKQNPAQSSGG